jgi:hypothetical protein
MPLVPKRYEQTQRGECEKCSDRRKFAFRSGAAIASLVALVTLSACGGGGDVGTGTGVTLDIGVMVGGQPVNGVLIQPGRAQSISISAGQPIELDANEAVQWTLEVGGSTVTGSGASVYYQGVTISVTALSSSRIALDTSAAFLLAAAVPVTLTAVSTYDSAVVATVNVLIAN